MRIRLLSVGRPKNAGMAALHEAYAARIRRFRASYHAEWVPEVPEGGRYSDRHVRERESRGLLEALQPGETVVALDRRGRQLTSEQLADRLAQWASRQAAFLVGGPLGLDERVVARADWTWSLSELTFPHELVRVMLAEQVYRALSIARGLPYHRGSP